MRALFPAAFVAVLAALTVVQAAIVCPPGYDCVYDRIEAAFANATFNCNQYPGFVCDGRTINLCKEGGYCPSALENERVTCPSGKWCPIGYSYPIPCPPTGFCAEGSIKNGLWLPLIVLLVACGALYVLYRLVRNGTITGECCGCATADSAKPAPVAGSGVVVSVGAKADAEPSIGSSDLTFTMANGMKTALVFDDVCIEVGTGSSKKMVLSHVTGKFQCGRLSAIMGPSGSGKTTFLNALTGRVKPATGAVTLNGVTPLSKLGKLIGFVPQDDVCLSMLTVRQVLTDSALSRLPEAWSLRKKLAIVDDVLDVLGLTRIANSTIGDETTRGISGGEKKRLSVGMELVACPAMLFLDEPTSGLDATSAKDLMAALQRVSQRGLIVAAVIHQPRSEIYEMLDDLLLLRTGGHVVYFGDAAASAPYLSWLGFPLPNNMNPADHEMDVVSGRVALRIGSGVLTPTPRATSNTQSSDSKEQPSPISITVAATGAGAALTLTPPPALMHLSPAAPTVDVTPDVTAGAIAIEDRDVPFFLSDAWANFRQTFSAKAVALEHDTNVRCTQAHIDHLLLSATNQLIAVASGASASNQALDAAGVSQAVVIAPAVGSNGAGAEKKLSNELEMTALGKPTKAVDAKAESTMTPQFVGDVLAARSPPGFVTQVWLYLYRRVLCDLRDPFGIVLDIGLQLLQGFGLGVGPGAEQYYAQPLPPEVAVTCPDLIKGRCLTNAIVGDRTVFGGFFVTMVMCVAASSFAVRTFGKYRNVWERERLCGRSLIAYYTAQVLYDLLHVTRSALFFTVAYYPMASYRGAFGWWYLTFWLISFAVYGFAYFISIAIGYRLSTVVSIMIGVFFAISSGLVPRLSRVLEWWPLPIIWSLSYNRWGGEALAILATRSSISGPEERIVQAFDAEGYNAENFSIDLGLLFVIGVAWRVAAFFRLRYNKDAV